MSFIKDGTTVLFQGDSVTDTNRVRENDSDFGTGYAMMTASWFAAMHPEKNVRFLNRGISGNRAIDLRGRWQEDCVDLKPDVVSILIGINDTWRRYDSNDTTSTETYEDNYRNIIGRTKNETNARIVLMEPFVLPYPEDRIAWREDLDPKIHVVRNLAREFGAILVPLDGIFAAASAYREAGFWSADGVHPSLAGHALIAQSWLKAVCEL